MRALKGVSLNPSTNNRHIADSSNENLANVETYILFGIMSF